MPLLEMEGKKYYYAGDAGRKGIPLLFCHGSGGGHHHWHHQLKNLPPETNPLAVDLPGHGRSEGAPAGDIAANRNWLHRFVKNLGLEPFVAAGHSMGGAIALDYALNYPEQTRGLILVGSGARLRVKPAFLEELKQDRVPQELLDYLYGPDASEQLISLGRREMENTDPAIYRADLTSCDRFDVMEQLGRIAAPTLLICGSEDRLTPVKYSQFLKDKIPVSRLAVIRDAGHMVMLENPEEVNRAIARFIKEDLR